jgi:hypothetical protein
MKLKANICHHGPPLHVTSLFSTTNNKQPMAHMADLGILETENDSRCYPGMLYGNRAGEKKMLER